MDYRKCEIITFSSCTLALSILGNRVAWVLSMGTGPSCTMLHIDRVVSACSAS